jgi:iron(III) transport system ATP-binding protein
MNNLLSVSGITCQYQDKVVIRDLSFRLGQGELGCLLGPSGCGKSTLLRAIAGFEPLTAGQIILNGNLISSPRKIVVPERRRIGMVFQDYALFPHLNVESNIRFGLRKLAPETARQRVHSLIELVDLQGFEHRYPHELSGGQQQRVALARALAPEPALILLDEPFSNLDAELRSRLSLDVRKILQELNIGGILVTHDQREAFAMCDQIGVIESGSIQQWGSAYELYHEPANRFVANFIGQGTFIRGRTLSHESFDSELGVLNGNRAYPWAIGNTRVDILIRPDDVVCNPSSPLLARVESRIFAGTSTHYQLVLPSGTRIKATFPSHQDFAVGSNVHFAIDAEHLIAYPSDS